MAWPQDQRKASAVAKLKQSIVDLSEENHRLKCEVDAGRGDLWTCNDTAEEIATVMMAKLAHTKAKCIAEAILNKLETNKKSHETRHLVLGKVQ